MGPGIRQTIEKADVISTEMARAAKIISERLRPMIKETVSRIAKLIGSYFVGF